MGACRTRGWGKEAFHGDRGSRHSTVELTEETVLAHCVVETFGGLGRSSTLIRHLDRGLFSLVISTHHL